MRTLDEVLTSLPAAERTRIDARAKELIDAYSLREVRRAVAKTQKDVAGATGIGQENVSRLEQRGDMLISTLSGYIRALGGELRLVADIPGAAPIEIALKGGPRAKAGRPASRKGNTGKRARTRKASG